MLNTPRTDYTESLAEAHQVVGRMPQELMNTRASLDMASRASLGLMKSIKTLADHPAVHPSVSGAANDLGLFAAAKPSVSAAPALTPNAGPVTPGAASVRKPKPLTLGL
jgi:hypothetical protein